MVHPGGVWLAIGYAAFGIVMFILFFLVVTIPFGIASFRLANYALWPFGRTVVPDPDAGAGSAIGNISGSFWPVFGWRSPRCLRGFCSASRLLAFRSASPVSRWPGWRCSPLGKRIVSIEG